MILHTDSEDDDVKFVTDSEPDVRAGQEANESANAK